MYTLRKGVEGGEGRLPISVRGVETNFSKLDGLVCGCGVEGPLLGVIVTFLGVLVTACGTTASTLASLGGN